MIKYLLTKLGRAGRETIWLSVMALDPYGMTSHLVNKYILFQTITRLLTAFLCA